MNDITFTHDGKKTDELCSFNIRHQIEGLLIYRPSELCVLSSKSDAMDNAFIEENNIATVKLGNGGGCIVAFPDNLEIGHFSKDIEDTFLEVLTEKVIDYLKGRGLNVVRDKNDVLIDGIYKVFSTAKARYDKSFLFSGAHISINCDADLVAKICTKPMKKIPKGLSEYGITSDEMLDLILGVYEE